MALSIDEIVNIYRTVGAARYGTEAVNQEQHAFQCAQQAELTGGGPELVAAALLHDLGHLVAVARPEAVRKDDLHEFVALPFLRGVFGDAVLEPIRMHVTAKRYLCYSIQSYSDLLSPASRRSLALQGGPLNHDEAMEFIGRRYAGDAVALRTWDDRAKDPACVTPIWDHYRKVLEQAKARALTPA